MMILREEREEKESVDERTSGSDLPWIQLPINQRSRRRRRYSSSFPPKRGRRFSPFPFDRIFVRKRIIRTKEKKSKQGRKKERKKDMI